MRRRFQTTNPFLNISFSTEYEKIFHKKLKTIAKKYFTVPSEYIAYLIRNMITYEYPPSYLTYGRPDRTGRSRNVRALPGI